MSEDPIPKEILQAARLRFKRHCAALICQMMAEDGASVAEIAACIGWDEAKWWRTIRALLEGKERKIDTIADLATAMRCELIPRAVSMKQVGEIPITPDEQEQQDQL